MQNTTLTTFPVHGTGPLTPKHHRYGAARLTVERVITTDGRPRADVVLHNASGDGFAWTTMDADEALELAEALKMAVRGEWACYSCATPIEWKGIGRPPLYCSPACRQQAYRDRQREGGD
jgi:hypothetical protein